MVARIQPGSDESADAIEFREPLRNDGIRRSLTYPRASRSGAHLAVGVLLVAMIFSELSQNYSMFREEAAREGRICQE